MVNIKFEVTIYLVVKFAVFVDIKKEKNEITF